MRSLRRLVKYLWRRAFRFERNLILGDAIRDKFRPKIEFLEERTVPTVLTVTTNADSGAGSLRTAITSANSIGGATIDFDIPGGGVQTINLASALPAITASATIIDGTSQPGYSSTPLIVLAGASAGNACPDSSAHHHGSSCGPYYHTGRPHHHGGRAERTGSRRCRRARRR